MVDTPRAKQRVVDVTLHGDKLTAFDKVTNIEG